MRVKAGERVGALMSTNPGKKLVRFFGYGTFMGELPCPTGPFGISLDELNAGSADPPPYTNPYIALDGGGHVWGMECWWGSEASLKQKIDGFLVDGWQIEMVESEIGEPVGGLAIVARGPEDLR